MFDMIIWIWDVVCWSSLAKCDTTRRKRYITYHLMSYAHSAATWEIDVWKHEIKFGQTSKLLRHVYSTLNCLLQFALSIIIFCSIQHRSIAHMCMPVWSCLVAYECFLFGKLKPPPIHSDQEDSAHHQIFIRIIMEIMPVMMTEHMQTKCAKFV